MVNYRLMGSATTNSNGVAVLSGGYTSVGNGEMDFIASTSNTITDSTLNSNSVTVLDCMFIGTGTTERWYNSSVTLENGVVKWTVPSVSPYCGVRGSVLLPCVGSTIKTHIRTTSEVPFRLAIYYVKNNMWITGNSIRVDSGEQTTDLTMDIPLGSTNIWVRLQSASQNELLEVGDEIYINEWLTYQI